MAQPHPTAPSDNDLAQSRKDTFSWLFIFWMVVLVLWVAKASECPPSGYADYGEITSYSELVSRHTMYLNPLVPLALLFVSWIAGTSVLATMRRTWLGLLLVLTIPFACRMIVGIMFSCPRYTILTHIDTVEFDGHLYHLAYNERFEEHSEGPELDLHKCKPDGDQCERSILSLYANRQTGPLLFVDEATNQLKVQISKDVIFILDPDRVLLSIPPEREVIAPDNLNSLKELQQLHYGRAEELVWSQDGSVLAASGYSDTWLHHFQDGYILAQMFPEKYGAIVFSPDQQLLQAWDWMYAYQILSADNPQSNQAEIETPASHRLFTTDREDNLILFDTDDSTASRGNHMRYGIDIISFSPDGRFLAANGEDYHDDGRDFIRVWDLANKKEIFFFPGSTSWGSSLRFSPDSSKLAFVTRQEENPDRANTDPETRIQVWTMPQHIRQLSIVISTADNHSVSDFAWSAGGDIFIVLVENRTYEGNRNTLQFWDALSGERLETIEIASESVTSIALHPDGTMLATGGHDGIIRLWGIPAATP